MSVDVIDLSAFYNSALGHVAQRYIERAIEQFLPETKGLRVLGLGYAIPYMERFRKEAASLVALMPAAQGVVNWPQGQQSATALVDPLALPLPDSSIDRVVLVHALETVNNPTDFLKEIWRILTPGGRLIMVTPNRRGLWARMDTTPFGQGQPFSRSQLRSLMREALFSTDNWAEILYVPPVDNHLLLKTVKIWETLGGSFSLPFSVAGLHVVDASKQLYRLIPAGQKQRKQRLGRLLVPAASPSTINSKNTSLANSEHKN
ncbi:class I SAM-dependent methyltransferase [Microvirga sp. W0021]|uniref:Class I SAM-dependent methyltransferase n=1 Tax=Hohaiivirga grylli TaxID=3133970 RepID=A0ABV0BL65_9HYPH